MEIRQKRRIYIGVILLISASFIAFMWSLNSGSVTISFKELLHILKHHNEDATKYDVIWKIRLPRTIAAAILGGALSISGYLLQTFFHNPIAGPFVLGISSGAKLVVALTMIFIIVPFKVSSSALLIGASFIGAMISMMIILMMASKVSGISYLVIIGVMIGYICSASTDFLVTFADESNIVNLHNWSMGTFSGMNWSNIKVMSIVVFSTFFAVFCLSKPIGVYQLGENYAQSMGVNVPLLRVLLILFSGLLSACVTAFAGPISFVGIAVPHLVKGLFKTAKPIVIIPGAFLGGAVFCMACDQMARTLFLPTELNISTVTAIFGAPIVIYLMIKRKREL